MKSVLVTTLLASFPALCTAQSKPLAIRACDSVKILVAHNAATRAKSPARLGEFGKRCTAGAPSKGDERPAHSSVCELLGPDIKEVLVEHYPASGNNSRQVVARLRIVLEAVPQDYLSSYIGWSEVTFPGIVATVRFRKGDSMPFEESAGHVCFVDRNRYLWFTRLRLEDLRPR